MIPFEKAAAWHSEHGGDGMTFTQVIEAHAMGGVVVITPTLFLLGRRVFADWEDRKLCDPWQCAGNGNAWHVFLAVGSAREAARHVPHPLPWITMHRGDRLVRMPWDRFRRLK